MLCYDDGYEMYMDHLWTEVPYEPVISKPTTTTTQTSIHEFKQKSTQRKMGKKLGKNISVRFDQVPKIPKDILVTTPKVEKKPRKIKKAFGREEGLIFPQSTVHQGKVSNSNNHGRSPF